MCTNLTLLISRLYFYACCQDVKFNNLSNFVYKNCFPLHFVLCISKTHSTKIRSFEEETYDTWNVDRTCRMSRIGNVTQWATWVTCYQLLTSCFFPSQIIAFLPSSGGLFYFFFCLASIGRSLFSDLSYPMQTFIPLCRTFSSLSGLCEVFWCNGSEFSDWWQFCDASCSLECSDLYLPFMGMLAVPDVLFSSPINGTILNIGQNKNMNITTLLAH